MADVPAWLTDEAHRFDPKEWTQAFFNNHWVHQSMQRLPGMLWPELVERFFAAAHQHGYEQGFSNGLDEAAATKETK